MAVWQRSCRLRHASDCASGEEHASAGSAGSDTCVQMETQQPAQAMRLLVHPSTTGEEGQANRIGGMRHSAALAANGRSAASAAEGTVQHRRHKSTVQLTCSTPANSLSTACTSRSSASALTCRGRDGAWQQAAALNSHAGKLRFERLQGEQSTRGISNAAAPGSAAGGRVHASSCCNQLSATSSGYPPGAR